MIKQESREVERIDKLLHHYLDQILTTKEN
jgi:hypothetical protein